MAFERNIGSLVAQKKLSANQKATYNYELWT